MIAQSLMINSRLSCVGFFLIALISPAFLIADKQVGSETMSLATLNPEICMPDLRDGDLVFRKGRSLVSRIVLIKDAKTDYSHIGIIAFIGPEPFVIHAVPGEPGENGEEVVKCESPEDFLSTEKASKFVVYRLAQDTIGYGRLAACKALEYYHEKLPFDKAMNFRTDDKLYCTELVWKAYLSAGINITDNKFHLISFSLFTDSLIMPSQIIENMSLTQIYP